MDSQFDELIKIQEHRIEQLADQNKSLYEEWRAKRRDQEKAREDIDNMKKKKAVEEEENNEKEIKENEEDVKNKEPAEEVKSNKNEDNNEG